MASFEIKEWGEKVELVFEGFANILKWKFEVHRRRRWRNVFVTCDGFELDLMILGVL